MPTPKPFYDQVLDFERDLIRHALIENDNSPTRAARSLGLNSHQNLLAMLDTRHKELRDELGITKRPRRKPLMTR
jgi:transcriptional regulator with GAF, ATPase, and Fis domain